MYYLIRPEGSIFLLDGSLVEGVICKKTGWFFYSKWVPFLSPQRLSQQGLLERAHKYVAEGDTNAIRSDVGIMSCAYRPGSSPEGTIFGEDQFPSFLVAWLRSSGIGERVFPPQQPEGLAAFEFNAKLGAFLGFAKQYLLEIGPEVGAQAFQETMLRALKRGGLQV